MIKSNWLIDHLKLSFILDKELLINDGLLKNIFSIDNNTISVERKESEIIELFLDEKNDLLYKIKYDELKKIIVFTLTEKKIDNKSNFLFNERDIRNIVVNFLNFTSNNFIKASISLSVYLQNEILDKKEIENIFKINKFNFLTDLDIETFEFSIGNSFNLDGINFRILKSFLFCDGSKMGDKVNIKKLGKDQILFFKQNAVVEQPSINDILKVFNYISEKI